MEMPRVLVLIVTYNGTQWIERCLESVSSSALRPDVLVVDNCSTDGTAALVGSLGCPGLSLIEAEKNLGFGQGNNIGLKKALEEEYDYVYLLNQDAYLLPDTLGTLVSAFEESAAAGKKYGVLSPLQYSAGLKDYDLYFKKHCGTQLSGAPAGCAVVDVPFVMAAHWMISTDCLREVGMFSPAFLHYGEDENFLDRARYHGWSCGVVPAAKAIHDRAGRKSSKSSRIRLKYVHTIVRVSDPCSPLAVQMLIQPLAVLGMSVKNCSAEMLGYLPRLIRQYPELARWRKESMGEGAFIG